MDTGKHQSPHKQHHSAAVSSSSNTSELDDFVISASFLRDAHVTSLWLKCLNLGFNLELITETFKEYLAQHFVVKLGNHTTLAALTSLTTADYKLIFNEDKFIERIIQLAENLNKASHADRSSDNDSPPLASDFANELNPKADEFVFGAASGNDFQPTSSESNRRMQLLLSHQQQQRAQAAHFQAVKLQQEQASHIKHKAMQDLLDQSISRLNDKSNLRPVIIDGNDVGTPTNTAKQVFSFCRVRKVAEFFEKRNHTIYVMFPQWRKESLVQAYVSMQQQKQQQQQNGGGQQSQQQPQLLNQQQLQAEQEALKDMEDKEIVNFTPSKRVGSKHIKTDDDMFILQLAVAKKAIIVSNDNFKRFLNHSEDFKHVVEERVLMYSFIDDTFMPAEDPLGKNLLIFVSELGSRGKRTNKNP
jgi:predicted metal-dependent hydrolase